MADQRNRGGKKEGTQGNQESEKHQEVHTGSRQTGGPGTARKEPGKPSQVDSTREQRKDEE
jgi:hypothetical protein